MCLWPQEIRSLCGSRCVYVAFWGLNLGELIQLRPHCQPFIIPGFVGWSQAVLISTHPVALCENVAWALLWDSGCYRNLWLEANGSQSSLMRIPHSSSRPHLWESEKGSLVFVPVGFFQRDWTDGETHEGTRRVCVCMFLILDLYQIHNLQTFFPFNGCLFNLSTMSFVAYKFSIKNYINLAQ